MGTWDKSILNAYAPKSVKTTDNSFYEDYQKKKTQQQKETEYRAKPVQRIIDSGEKKTKKKSEEKGSTESAKSEPVRVQLDNPFNRDSKLFQSFQPFSERKKTGNVFTPSTLFTRNRQMFQADMPRLRETAKQNMSFGRATRKAAENPFADGDVVFDDIMKNYTKADGGRYYRALNLNRAVNNLLRNWRNTEKNMPGNKGYENTWNTYKANNAGDIQLYEKLTGRKFDPVELGDLDAKAVNQAKKTVERKYNEAYQNRVEQHYNTVSSPDFAAYANRQGVFAKKSKVDDVINNMKLMTEAEYIKANPRVTDLSKLNRYYDAGSGKEYIVLGLNSEKQSDVNILYMNDTERKIYNYYLNKYGEGKANKYLDDIQMVLDARRVKNHQSIVEAKSHKDWVYGGLTSMKSGIENSVGLIDAPVQALKQNISTPSEYKPSNPYRVANEGVYTQQAAHQGIERDMSPTGKWIAERVLSVTDQAPSRIVSLAGMPHLGLGMMAGAAGTQARVDAISRGATEAQAGMYGLTSGTIEYLTEALPLFQWVELFKAPKGQLISFFKNLAINSATEAGEEVIADYANAAADRVINGDKSQVNQYINELMQDGMSKEQAQEGAYWKYFVLEPAQDAGAAFVDSLLMGVAPGVTAPISETLDTGAELKNLGVTQSVVDTGLESDTSTAARKYAERMQAKQDEGKPLSDWNVGRQYQKNVKAIEQENATQRAFQNATNIVREQQQNLPNNVNGMFTPAYNEQGQLDTRNSKIETSLNSDTSQLANDKHEYYHAIRQIAPELSARYEDYAYEALKDTEAVKSLDTTLRKVYGEEYSEDVLKDEIGALTAEMMDYSPQRIQRIADGKENLGDRLTNALDKARTKVQTAFAKTVNGRFGLEYTPEQLNELKGLWASTVRQASENVRNGNLAQGEGGDRYSFAGVNSQTADMESLADVNTQTEEKGSVKERFSLNEAVEETKDLIALHNVSEDNINRSLDLGGLPMPSIAVTRAQVGHTRFGDASLVFYKDTIDPQVDDRNKVYSRDAYTPVVLSEYRKNPKSKYALSLDEITTKMTKDQSEVGRIVERFNTLDNIKQSEGQIQAENISSQKRAGFKTRLRNIYKKMSTNDFDVDWFIKRDFVNPIIEKINSGMTLQEAIDELISDLKNAVALDETESSYHLYKVDDKTAEELKKIIKEIANMPTRYFEAKPQRGVGFDEVAAAVVPQSWSEETKQRIRDKGVDVIEYDGTKEDRISKVNSVPDVMFSIKEHDGAKENTNERPVFRARNVNDIANDTTLTEGERRQELEDLIKKGQERGREHFKKQQNIQDSEYSEEDWESLDPSLNINNAKQEMNKREQVAEEYDNSKYDREDWENLMANNPNADLDDILPENYDWSKDAENWDKPKQKSEADEMTSAEKLRTLMEEKGVSSPSELAEKTVSRDDTRKRNNAFYRTKAGIHTLMSRAYTAMVDDMHPLWQYTDSFEKSQTRLNEKGKKVTPHLYGKENAYKMAMNAKDASSRAAYLITDYLTDFDANIIGKGLVDTIVDEGGISTQDYDAFNEYLVAKHALEWLSEDSGGKYKKVYADDMMNDVGVVSEIVKDFEAKYPHFAAASELVYDWQRKLMKAWLVDTGVISEDQYNYLTETYPCYVPFYRETGVASVGGHTGFANLDDVLKKALGSGERILSPIENIMYNVASYVNYASKHAVTKAAVDMYDILESDPANNILRNFWEEVIPKNPKEFEPTQFVKKDEVLDATEEAPGLSISDSLKAQTGVQGNIVTVMDDGKPRYFEVKDKDFLNVLDNVRKGREGWLAIFAAASRVRGALLTTFKPQFALVTNPIRDFGTLLVNSSDANKAKVMGAAVSSYGDIIKKSENYQKWKAMGGEYSSFATEGKNDLRKAMQKLDPSTAKKVVRKVMSAFGVYSNFANAIETAPRLGEYKQAVKAGYDVHEAFYRGKDVTINFSRGGKLAKYANSVSNFFNAAVQGTDKFFRQTKNNPTSFAVGMGVLALISLLKYGWDKWMEDDKYKEAYKDLSNYQKNNSWNFYIGNGKFVSLPKPRENAVLISLMEAAVDRYVEGQDDRFKGFLKHAIGTFLPDGSVLGVSDYIALRANKDYRDVPIVGKELEKLPKELQFDDSTSYAAKWLGGLLKQSPKQIDYLINSNAGVLGTANKTYFTPKSTKDKAAMYTFGLSNTFLKDAYYSTDMVTNFYNNKDEADKQANGYPSADTAYLSNRYYQANNVMGIINGMVKDNAENTKPFDMMEAFRWYRRAYTNYAAENKDNPKGFSDEVYQEIKGLYDTDNTVLQLPKVDSTIKANKQEYTFDDPYTVMQYQTDLNNAVDKAYRDIIGTAEYQVKSNDDKAAALKKAKDDAVKAVKKLYVENGGKVTSEAAPKGAINKPSAETVAVAQQKADRKANVQSTYVEQLSADFKAANPTKDGYSVDTMLKLEPTEVTIGDKKYKVSGDVANKIASAAEDKFYDNIESFYSGDTSIEYLIGSGKKKPKYAEDKNGKRVYMTGSRYNADGSKRFDETVEGKIIFKLKEAAVNSAAKEYEAEVKGEGTSNNTAEKGINAGTPSDSFVRTPVGNYRKSSNKSSGRKSSGRKSSGSSSSKSSGTKVAKSTVSFKPRFTPSFSFTPKTTTARLRFKPRLSGYNKVRNTRLRLGNKKGVIV